VKKKYIALFFIILIAVFLRFFKLGNIPPSLTWDEAAWGYNAYSLGIDGRDEFGRFLPFDYLESFGDFKPVVYAYLDIIPIKIFGLNEFAVRFPSAFFGVLTVLVTYFLTRRLFHPRGEAVALLSAFFLAISPWHVNLSRAAFEANVATFFIVSGVWLFLYGIQKRKWFLILSIASFVLSLYTFNTARIVAPVLVLILAIGFRKKLLLLKKQVLLAVFFGILLIFPTLKFFLSPQANLRFREVNIFSDPSIIETANQEIANDGDKWWSKIIHNRRFAYGVQYVRHYFDNFNPNFLFIKGDGNPKFSTQDVGQMYLWELPFFIGGILMLFRRREGNWWIVPLWLLIGIIPAATARETPHALRIEATLPTFQILVAYGLVNLVLSRKYCVSGIKKIKYFILTTLYLLLFVNFIYYLHGYYVHYPREYSGEWQYGYRESIEYIKSVQDKYDEILITTKLGRPYVYYAFYMQVDPQLFRDTVSAQRDPFGFVTVDKFSKYKFSGNLGSVKTKARRILYIDAPSRVPAKAQVIETFSLLNGETELVAYIR